jgi:hypothetical protein
MILPLCERMFAEIATATATATAPPAITLNCVASSHVAPVCVRELALFKDSTDPTQRTLHHVGVVSHTAAPFLDVVSLAQLDAERDAAIRGMHAHRSASCSDESGEQEPEEEEMPMRVANAHAISRHPCTGPEGEVLVARIFPPGAWRPAWLRMSNDVPETDTQDLLADTDEQDVDAAACELCDRHAPLTRHHLIPRTTHAKFIKLGYAKQFLLHHVIEICRPCHSSVHRFADESTLAMDFNSLAKLLGNATVRSFVQYHAGQRVRTKVITGSSGRR